MNVNLFASPIKYLTLWICFQAFHIRTFSLTIISQNMTYLIRICCFIFENILIFIGFYFTFFMSSSIFPLKLKGSHFQVLPLSKRQYFNGNSCLVIIYLLQMKGNPYLDSDSFVQCINWNPSSNLEDEQLLCLPNESRQSSNPQNEKKRPSHKNKYINKITKIKPEETATTKKRQLNVSEVALQPELFKKIKNRQAAKESRQRKKLYINLIEEQTTSLEREIQNTNKLIQGYKIEIQKSTFNHNQSIGAFDSKIVHVFKKLERLVSIDESQQKNNELNLAIDSMIYRYGAAGKERKSKINEIYRQIMSITPSIVHRYFMWAVKNNAHFFVTDEENGHQEWFGQMRRILMPNIDENRTFIEEVKVNVGENQKDYSKNVTQLMLKKDQIENYLNILDQQFLQIRDLLTPTQAAKLILFIDKYKYRNQFQFIQNRIQFQVENGLSAKNQGSIDQQV